MKVDVVCVADPYLDLIFRGLPAIPVAGSELNATSLVVVPGGVANVAFALRRLELDAIICAPIGRDGAGQFLAQLLADAGVPWVGRPGAATPVTVALPAGGDRALVSVMPEPTVDLQTLAGISARAVVVDLPSVPTLPAHPRVYAVLGDPEVEMMRRQPLPSLDAVHALLLNEREACALADLADVHAAAAHLASLGTTAVVTRGSQGAMAVEPGGRTVTVPARPADVADATGAGDLFVASYIWADLDGCPLEERLRLATSYASWSLERATDRQKGISRRELDELLAT